MPRSIEDVFDFIDLESRYASWDRLVLLGTILLLFATSLGMLWLALLPLNLANSWIFLLLPSLILGFWGLVQFTYGRDKIAEVNDKIKALRERSELAGLSEASTNNDSVNKPR
jgi:hypothetical protein